MKLLLDTNILVSAALFPDGRAAQAYETAVSGSYDVVVPRYVLDEMESVFRPMPVPTQGSFGTQPQANRHQIQPGPGFNPTS